jgi:adenosylhomocysteine nucleosidase
LINLGTCGGFEGQVDRGTIILAEQTLVYDIIEQMGDPDEHIAHYATELDLGWLGDESPQSVRRALLVSADRDLLTNDVSMLRARYNAIAADWESGAIAWVAARNGVRCLILRGVTDLVGSDGGEAYGNLPLYEQETAAVIGSLLDALPAWIAQAKGRIQP